MIAYGRRKIRTNFKDHHPKRDYANWWEVECNYINKKAERRKARKDIVNYRQLKQAVSCRVFL